MMRYDFWNQDLAVFSENYCGGGQDLTTSQYLERFESKGHRPLLIANKDCINTVLGHLEKTNIRSMRINTYSSSHYYYQVSGKRLFRGIIVAFSPVIDAISYAIGLARFSILMHRTKIKIAYVFNGGHPASCQCIAFIHASKLCGAKVYYSIVSIPQKKSKIFNIGASFLDRFTWSCCSLIIANCMAIKEQLAISRGAPRRKIEIVHNCIDDYPPRSKSRMKKDISIGVVSRLDKLKNTVLLLKSFLDLCEEGHPIRLEIVGSGPEKKALEALALKSNAPSRISFKGEIRDKLEVHEFISSLDIYAFTSLWEGFPYSILEAMRAGCAIVSSDVGGIKEALIHEHNSILTGPNDLQSLTDALRTLITSKAYRDRLGSQARIDFSENFTISKMTQSLEYLDSL